MKGILFNTDMHIAVREDRKTLTRRLDGLKEINKESDDWYLENEGGLIICNSKTGARYEVNSKSGEPYAIMSRYQVGKTVYIKEAWRYFGGEEYEYQQERGAVIYKQDVLVNLDIHKWHSPLFMPAWAARDFIKITDVRLERLQDITEGDAKAEGVEATYKVAPNTYGAGYIWTPHGYRDSFIKVWDSINEKRGYSWAENPYVWRIEFERGKL